MTEAPEGKVVEIEPRFRLIPFDRVTIGSERLYLVKGLIPRTGLVVPHETLCLPGWLPAPSVRPATSPPPPCF